MNQARSFGFEALEARMLLSTGHVAATHAAREVAAPAAQLMLDGTLTVDNRAAVMVADTNVDGGSTTATPVSGQFATLGTVRGVWDESIDAYGDYVGPDTITLRSPKGTIVIAFSEQSLLHTHTVAHGSANYEYPQREISGAGAYAHSSEKGTIELTTSNARTSIVSMQLQTGKV